MMHQERRDRNNEELVLPAHIKRVGVIFNPRSGAGRAAFAAEQARDLFERAGVAVEQRESSRSYELPELEKYLRSVDALVVAGGDGTVMPFLPSLAETGTPLYMLPSGNESLFARNFGMASEADSIARIFSQWKVESHYYGLVRSTPFFSMASVGLDSEIIAHIDSYRCGPIGHLGYIRPTLQVLGSHVTPAISLKVDGTQVLTDEPGYLIIANTPEYALRINPVPEAGSHLPSLHARFFPHHGALEAVSWMINAWLKQPVDLGSSRLFTGRQFELAVTNSESYPVQADGDSAGRAPAIISLSEKQVKVISGK